GVRREIPPSPIGQRTGRQKQEDDLPPLTPRWSKGGICLAIGLAMMLVTALPGLDMALLAPVMLIAATVVQVWGGGDLYRAAWRAARHGATTMDTLVVAGTSIAYGYSAFVTLWPSLADRWNLQLQPTFETGALIIAL